MTQKNETRSYVAAVAIAFYSFGCASSQIASDPQHPASAEAPRAPLPPVGEALSDPGGPGAMAANSTDSRPHEGHGTTEGTHPSPQAPDVAASHLGHAGAASTSTAGDRAGHERASVSQSDKEGERWTCPMHPEVVQSEPGKCPKCGMKLVPVRPKP
jgi:hypothetical protein